ncbi:CHAD domain-containing protein [Halopseudomonas sabulinigri]|uniref:CHAD domain-containing protein n=1 Tax=Halopseudomonas sabulinigri TaxID=472181 RepID=A0A1H1WUK1_9GAMM|nr:CHAD domain-containing protein [Halopseudomonas sabulinigri]SDT00804.1 CHAD domain-containing protein [Halopseudomonas sabulinigri]
MKHSADKPDPIFQAARKQVRKALKALPADATPSDEDIHAIRVCSKKLRALLQLYRPGCAKADIKQVEQRLKQLAASYAGLRDAHVQEKTLARLITRLPPQQQAAMQPLFAYFASAASAAGSQITPEDPHQGFAEILADWQTRLKLKHRKDPVKGLDYTYRRARALALEAHDGGEDETYHQCRKWSKYYLYQAQLLCNRKAAKASIELLKQLGERLGLFQDHCVLEDSLQSEAAQVPELGNSVAQVLVVLEEQKQADKEQARQLFEQLYQQPHVPLSC